MPVWLIVLMIVGVAFALFQVRDGWRALAGSDAVLITNCKRVDGRRARALGLLIVLPLLLSPVTHGRLAALAGLRPDPVDTIERVESLNAAVADAEARMKGAKAELDGVVAELATLKARAAFGQTSAESFRDQSERLESRRLELDQAVRTEARRREAATTDRYEERLAMLRALLVGSTADFVLQSLAVTLAVWCAVERWGRRTHSADCSAPVGSSASERPDAAFE